MGNKQSQPKFIKNFYSSIILKKGTWLIVQPNVDISDFYYLSGFVVHNKPHCIEGTLNENYGHSKYFWVTASDIRDIVCSYCNTKMRESTKEWFGKRALLICDKKELKKAGIIQ